MIDISIICPVYKAESYIRRCIDSILASCFVNWELILIDDGSPDSSGEICDEYAANDERIRVIHKENEGVSVARQIGLDAALGDYVIHIDPDDWIEPTMYSELFNEAIKSNADLTFCDFYWDYGSKVVRHNLDFEDKSPENLLRLLIKGPFHGSCWNKLVRRDFIFRNKIRFPEGFKLYEDMYVIASILLCKPHIAYVNNAGYHYNMVDNSNSLTQYVSQYNYDYDMMVLSRFTNLLRGTSVCILAENHFALLALVREFDRGSSSNYQFCKRFIRYREVCRNLQLRTWPLYYLSCLGFYRPMKLLMRFLKKIKSTNVK